MFSTLLLSSVFTLGDVNASDKNDLIPCMLFSVWLYVRIPVPTEGPSYFRCGLHPKPIARVQFCGKSRRWPCCVYRRMRFLVWSGPDGNCIKLIVPSPPLKWLIGCPCFDY